MRAGRTAPGPRFAAALLLGLAALAPATRASPRALPPSAVDALWQWAQWQQRAIDRDGLVREAREQAALARLARPPHGDAELFPDAHVGFAPDVAMEDRLVGMLRSLHRERLEQALRTLPGGTLDGLVVEWPALSADALTAALGAAGAPRVEYALTPAQHKRAAQCVVLRYRLAPTAAVQSLTLGELYRRQNVQGRIALHQFDRDALRAQAMQYLAGRVVLARVSEWQGADYVAALRDWVADRERVGALARWYGVGADAHDEVAHLRALAAAVTPADIRAYYAAHTDEFRRIDRVRARHIRVADEAAARAVQAELARPGSDFAAVARRRSLAPDAPGGGELGWIGATDHGWLGDLAFALPPGELGKPTREPLPAEAAAAWEIVQVEAREESLYPADSETVAWSVRHTLARQRAAAEFRALRAQARREAAGQG